MNMKDWLIPLLQTFLTVFLTLVSTWTISTVLSAMQKQKTNIAILEFMKNRILVETRHLKLGLKDSESTGEDTVYLLPCPSNITCSLAEYVELCKASSSLVYMMLDQDKIINIATTYQRTVTIEVAKSRLKTLQNDYAVLETEFKIATSRTWLYYWWKEVKSFFLANPQHKEKGINN